MHFSGVALGLRDAPRRFRLHSLDPRLQRANVELPVGQLPRQFRRMALKPRQLARQIGGKISFVHHFPTLARC